MAWADVLKAVSWAVVIECFFLWEVGPGDGL